MTKKKFVSQRMKDLRKQTGMPIPLAKAVVKAFLKNDFDKITSLGVGLQWDAPYFCHSCDTDHWDLKGVVFQGKLGTISW